MWLDIFSLLRQLLYLTCQLTIFFRRFGGSQNCLHMNTMIVLLPQPLQLDFSPQKLGNKLHFFEDQQPGQKVFNP